MALGSGAFEIRYGGNDNNAGYFNASGSSPGTDYSQQDAAQVTIDGATVTATVHTTTTQLNITGSTVTAAWNRNGLRITGGTATAGLYEITAVDTVNNRITLDRSAGTAAQTATGTMGGAFASIGILTATGIGFASGHVAYIKYNANAILTTTASTNVSGGSLVAPSGTVIIGYDTNRTRYNKDTNRPTLKINSGVSSATIIAGTNNTPRVQNIIFDGNSQTGSAGVFHSGTVWNCKFMNFVGTACKDNTKSGVAYNCEATGNSSAPFSMAVHWWCVAYANSTHGFVGSGNMITCYYCKSYSNTGSGKGFYQNSGTFTMIGCTAHNNAGRGFDGENSSAWYMNCLSTQNNGHGYYCNTQTHIFYNCADYGNSSGRMGNGGATIYDNWPITGLTQPVYVDAANGDLTLNNTAGGGAAVRALAWPTADSRGKPDYRDVGASQHQDSGSGGGLLTNQGLRGGFL